MPFTYNCFCVKNFNVPAHNPFVLAYNSGVELGIDISHYSECQDITSG